MMPRTSLEKRILLVQCEINVSRADLCLLVDYSDFRVVLQFSWLKYAVLHKTANASRADE